MNVPPAHHPIITGVLLGLAVAIAIVCCVGMAVMRDAFQRIHFSAPVVAFSSLFIIIAVWVEETDPQARVKTIMIGGLLLGLNAVLTHATAKAVRIKESKRWKVLDSEGIPLIGRDTPPGGPKGG
jgi:multisubunit Na+/H+ antiporter MnhG subunit